VDVAFVARLRHCGRVRRRGVKVIMVGPHVFFYPDEAAEHCDAIGIGEAESIWAEMLADALKRDIRPLCSTRISFSVFPSLARSAWTFRATAPSKLTRCNPRAAARFMRILLRAHLSEHRLSLAPRRGGCGGCAHCGGRSILFAESNFGGEKERAMS
jgi:radical SAM superfamily enzyme YgiQ (UPF0313 family)